ncbi:oxidoreductase [Mycobacterium tuberculosis]|nr:oxidoreductase [Mycobacterium tuberculosis]
MQNCSTTWPKLRDRPRLGVSVLVEGHDAACMSLSRKEGNRFAGVFWSELSSGGVVIAGAGAWLDCRPYAEIPAGDHLIALLEICAVRADPETPPLVFHGSRFRRLESR